MSFARHDRVKWVLKDGTQGKGECVQGEMDVPVVASPAVPE